jgi:hypothetical protein
MPIFLPLLAAAARIAGPAVTKKAIGGAVAAAKTPMGKGAIGGYMVGKAVGRNSNMQQGQEDGQPRENMQNYFPGRGGY